MKVTVGVSKRHVHLTKETFNKLFGDIELEVRNKIGQPGQFASTLAVDLKWKDKVLENVRIVGPLRSYDQAEISISDADKLEMSPPRLRSGEFEDSWSIIMVGPKGEVKLEKALMMVWPHVHLTPALAEELDVKDDERVNVYHNGACVAEALVKVEENAAPEFHIDNDEEHIYNLHNNDEVEIVKSKVD